MSDKLLCRNKGLIIKVPPHLNPLLEGEEVLTSKGKKPKSKVITLQNADYFSLQSLFRFIGRKAGMRRTIYCNQHGIKQYKVKKATIIKGTLMPSY